MVWRGKENLILRVCIYTVLVPGLVALICYITTPPPKLNHSSFGNNLSLYFYYIATDADASLTVRFTESTKYVSNSTLRRLYKRLTWTRLDNKIGFDSDHYNTWIQVDQLGAHKANYLQYWQALRPVVKKTFAKNFAPRNVEHPVVHFRCSDVPFLKCTNYHLTKKSSVAWMAQHIKDRGFNNIILLACNKHKSVDKENSCERYTQFYEQVFAESNITVDRQCNSIEEDFTTMLYSPLLVSLNASSFSFMAGMTKDPNDYIACNMGAEIKGEYYLQTEADWILDTKAPLLHLDVDDYYDVQDVIAKLVAS